MTDSQEFSTNQTAFVDWFRTSSPYIHAHRNRTFVVFFSGEAVSDETFAGCVHDFALLNSLGIRLVLVHGIRYQIEQRLTALGTQSVYQDGVRITDSVALQCVKEAAGTVRVELEALLSMGLYNSPMSGAAIQVTSGNFVTAKPLGVLDGIDFGYTGEVRRIDGTAILKKLEQSNVVIVSPIGYSPTGEIFNLCAEHVAAAVAIELNADKLLILCEDDPPQTDRGQLIRQLTTQEARKLLDTYGDISSNTQRYLNTAVRACESGIKRTHLIQRKIDGAILQELFTRDGIGTLVSSTQFEALRPGTLRDIGGILELIVPLEQKGILVKRSRELLEMEIKSFSIIERDGLIVGCAALKPFPDKASGELACVALHPDYQGESRGTRLMEHIEINAIAMGLKKIFVLTTQTTHWFREHGFEPASASELPVDRQVLYNFQRNSKILVKTL